MARLKEQYVNEIAPALNSKFGYKMTSVLNPVAYRFSLYRYRFPRLFGSDHTPFL